MPSHAIIVPACNEEPCIVPVLRELLPEALPECGIVVGVNGTTDRTAAAALSVSGVEVVETGARGYGFGCQAAVGHALAVWPQIESFIFYAADGANVPADIRKLLDGYDAGYEMVLGRRTRLHENRRVMGFTHICANRLLGTACGLLTGRFFEDLGPLRLIERRLFQAIAPCEMTYGWTIEAQVRASLLGARILEVDVAERSRKAGEQKVSRVSWRHTLRVGAQIFAAGMRSRLRPLPSWFPVQVEAPVPGAAAGISKS